MEKVPTLPAEVEKEFTCVKVIPGEVVWRNQKIDLTTIDKATAEQLVKDKFPYLVKKTGSVTPPVQGNK